MTTRKERYTVFHWRNSRFDHGFEVLDTSIDGDRARQSIADCDTETAAKRLAAQLNSHQALVDALEALEPFAVHAANCAVRSDMTAECNCGFRAAREQAHEALKLAKE